jgi:hypothetical protein
MVTQVCEYMCFQAKCSLLDPNRTSIDEIRSEMDFHCSHIIAHTGDNILVRRCIPNHAESRMNESSLPFKQL